MFDYINNARLQTLLFTKWLTSNTPLVNHLVVWTVVGQFRLGDTGGRGENYPIFEHVFI